MCLGERERDWLSERRDCDVGAAVGVTADVGVNGWERTGVRPRPRVGLAAVEEGPGDEVDVAAADWVWRRG